MKLSVCARKYLVLTSKDQVQLAIKLLKLLVFAKNAALFFFFLIFKGFL